MEERAIGHRRLLARAVHAQRRAVGEDVAAVHLAPQGILVCQVEQAGIAAELASQERRRAFGRREEVVAGVEQRDRLDARRRGLDGHRGGRATHAGDGHLATGVGHAGVVQRPQVAGAVGDVAGERAALVDDGVHGAGHARHRRERVEMGADRLLQRHGDVGAARTEDAQCVHRPLHAREVDVEGEVGEVQPQRLERRVLQLRRPAVRHRRAQQGNQARPARDLPRHAHAATAGAAAPPRNSRSMSGSASSSPAGLVQHQPARLQRDGVVGHLQRALDVLLDHQHRVPCSSASLRSSLNTSCTTMGDRPIEGSSISSTLGRSSSARPISSCFCSPPESDEPLCSAPSRAGTTPAPRGCARAWSSCPA
jgi:hypothetical protein